MERFVAEFDSSHSLALLPNYAFALPMARFKLEQQHRRNQGIGSTPQQDSNSTGDSIAAENDTGVPSSFTLLAQALLLHPLVLVELLDKLQGQGGVREDVWQQLKKRKLYAKVGGATGEGRMERRRI